MSKHDDSHPEGQNCCDEIFASINGQFGNLVREKKTSCGFYLKGGNRFAYIYHKKGHPGLRIYFRGDSEVVPSEDSSFDVQTRQTFSNPWETTFPHFFDISDPEKAPDIAQFLREFAIPLGEKISKKRSSKKKQITIPKTIEEITSNAELREGLITTVSVNRYERNSVARRICIQKYGCICFVCKFNFERIYGEIGVDYIQVHHLQPLASIKEDYTIDPISDLRPVCANCHAMIHRSDPPLTCEEVSQLMKDGPYQVD